MIPGRYLVKRIAELVPILFAISLLTFLFVHLIPGDPARLVAGEQASHSEVELVRDRLGLNESLIHQYIDYMGGLFHGDLGTSLKTGDPATPKIAASFMPTFWLTLISMVWAVIAGVALGILSATKRNRWPDYTGMVAAVSGISMPSFWLGLLLIALFSVQLGWLPTGGLNSWASYILPSITLGTTVAAIIARFTRSSVIETLREDYVRTAKSKGLRRTKIVWKHAFRNAMVPILTMTGLEFGFLLGGSIVVETVFSWPGLGRLLIESINFRDYPVIQGEILLFSLEFILINLAVDILYVVINPQVRYE